MPKFGYEIVSGDVKMNVEIKQPVPIEHRIREIPLY